MKRKHEKDPVLLGAWHPSPGVTPNFTVNTHWHSNGLDLTVAMKSEGVANPPIPFFD